MSLLSAFAKLFVLDALPLLFGWLLWKLYERRARGEMPDEDEFWAYCEQQFEEAWSE